MAAHSPQDVYARHLVSGRGYPLWTPEPSMSLPDAYRREGLKIGDVGVVVPEDGSFDVFFNVCLPPTHSLHLETGVPDNFSPILLKSRDIIVYPEAESAGRVISTTSVARSKNTNAPEEVLAERRPQLGPLNYEFTLSSNEGAVLILPEGAERYYLRNERPFLTAAVQHAVDWYTFAEQRLGRIISHDALYLITGFYKARSWSLAAYQQGAGMGDASAQFKAVQVGRGNVAASYTWETTQAMDWRVGPSDQYYHGIPNQSVFIQGFKIAVRDGILGSKWVNVKADIPSVHPCRIEYSGGSWLSSFWGGTSGSSISSKSNITRGADTRDTDNNLPFDRGDSVQEDITIHRFPQVTKPFHPSDIINRYLLREAPSATVAVTHDNLWTALLENGLLTPGELSQEDCVVALVRIIYQVMLISHGDAVYLENREIDDDDEYDEEMMNIARVLSGSLERLNFSRELPGSDFPESAKPSKSPQVLPTTAPTTHSDVQIPASDAQTSVQFQDMAYHTSRNQNIKSLQKKRNGKYELSTTPCNFCKGRDLKCDRALLDCGGCQRRTLPCIYDQGKDKKAIRSIFSLSELELETWRLSLASTLVDFPSSHLYTPLAQAVISRKIPSLQKGSTPEEPLRFPVSCERCRAQNVACHNPSAGGACARCSQLKIRCVYNVPDHTTGWDTNRPREPHSYPEFSIKWKADEHSPGVGRRVPTLSCKSCQARNIQCDGFRPTCANCIRGSNFCDYSSDTKVKKGIAEPILSPFEP